MNLRQLIKTILIALLIYALGIILTSLIVRYVIIIPVPIALSLESSFFLTYLYSQFVFNKSLKKGFIIEKAQRLRIYTIVWIIIMVVMMILNYILY